MSILSIGISFGAFGMFSSLFDKTFVNVQIKKIGRV